MRTALAAGVVLVLALTGCGGTDETATDTPSASSQSPTSTRQDATDDHDSDHGDDGADDGGCDPGSDTADSIEIEIEGDRIEPNGIRVQATVGEPVRLEIESDRAGELHVHSSPEQELPIKKGESVVELTLDTPGIVDVEEHETETVIVQLEVR